jgi:hypothetical protein
MSATPGCVWNAAPVREPETAAPVPIFVITCDRTEVLRKSIASYHAALASPFEIVIHDNASTYPPMLEFLEILEGSGTTVFRNAERVEHPEQLNSVATSVETWMAGHDARHYVVTDPDIALEPGCGDLLELYADLLDEHPELEVVGPMLRIDDIPDGYPLKQLVIELHTDQFWHKDALTIDWRGRAIRYQHAPIDTTFGMYRRGYAFHRLSHGLRTYEPYWARHLDWYLEATRLTEDQRYYLRNATEVSHWGGSWLRRSLTPRPEPDPA